MSATSPNLTFTDEELDLIGRTADALSAYMGKPVLAEVIDAEETGYEWICFAVPLETESSTDDIVVVQVGGAGARILGNKGGLDMDAADIYDCEYLWGIQLSDLEGVRFIKVDHEGEEVAWSDDLRTVLPFMLTDEAIVEDSENDDEDDSVDIDDASGENGHSPRAGDPDDDAPGGANRPTFH